MDINLVFLVFCLTLLGLVAMSRDKDQLAKIAAKSLGKLSAEALKTFRRFPGKFPTLNEDDNEQLNR